MIINLTTPMSDDKERQRRNEAVLDAIEQYTEEHMNDQYGKIHTDGSRSGGQPVLKPCGHCGKQCADLIIDQGDKWAHYSASCLEVRTGYNLSDDAPWRDEAIAAWNIRQPTQSDSLADKSDDYAIGYLSVLLERELYEDGWIIGEDLAEKLAEIAVQTVRQPTQSDALQTENEQLRHDLERQMTIANEHVNEVERLREALRNIRIEAEREKGSWVHLKRVIALNCKTALQEQGNG